jgi:transposase
MSRTRNAQFPSDFTNMRWFCGMEYSCSAAGRMNFRVTVDTHPHASSEAFAQQLEFCVM